MDIKLDIFGRLLVLKDQNIRLNGALETYCTRCGCPFPTSLRRMPDGKTRSIPQCGDCRHRYARRPKPSQQVLPLEVPATQRPFRPGDRVKCLRLSGYWADAGKLAVGGIYTVRSTCRYCGGNSLQFEEVRGALDACANGDDFVRVP